MKSADQKVQTDWFRHVQQQYNKIPPVQILSFMRMTAGTGLYPRDMFMKAKAGTMLPIHMSDGRVITGRQLRVDPVTWQGFMLRLTTNQSVGTGSTVAPTWPTPILQTAPFWDAGSPTGITIPTGVEVMSFHAGYRVVGGGYGDYALSFNIPAIPYKYGQAYQRGPATNGMTINSGPVVVTPGDFVVAQVFMTSSGTLDAAGPTFFGGTILQGS